MESPFIELRTQGNVLVSSERRALLSDFGQSGKSGSEASGAMRHDYAPPELYSNDSGIVLMSPATDVFSFGFLIIEVYSGEPPYGDMSPAGAIIATHSGKRPQRPDSLPKDLWIIAQRCWTHEAKDRPQMKDIHVELTKLKL